MEANVTEGKDCVEIDESVARVAVRRVGRCGVSWR